MPMIVIMNSRQSSKSVFTSFRMRVVWIWTTPATIETGFIVLFSCCWLAQIWSGLDRDVAGYSYFLSLCFATAMPAVRHWHNLPVRYIYGSIAIGAAATLAWLFLRKALGFRGLSESDSWETTIRSIVICAALFAAMLAFAETAVVAGVRKRHQSLPHLLRVLTTGGKCARRKAIVAFNQIAGWDCAYTRSTGGAWRRLERSMIGAGAPQAMKDAVPAIQGALQDEDFFVRAQAAKVLTHIGVAIPVAGLGGSETNIEFGTCEHNS